MVFRKSKLFEMASSSADGRALHMDKSDISQLNSYVISASIAGKHLTGLKEKVRTIFKPIKVSIFQLTSISKYCHLDTVYTGMYPIRWFHVFQANA